MSVLVRGEGFGSYYRKRIMHEAIDLAAHACAVPYNDVVAGRRSGPVAFARQVAMYLCHVVGDLSIRDVADELARDRSTVSHACHAIEDRRDDPVFDRDVEALEEALRLRIKKLIDEIVADTNYEKKGLRLSA